MVRTRTPLRSALAAAAVAALALLLAASAQASRSVVGPDGNLWLTTPTQVKRVTPTGEVSGFGLPAGAVADVIASGPGPRLSLVTHNATGSPAYSLRSIATDGAWDARVVALPQPVYDSPYIQQGLAVDTAGTTWFAQGWGACVGGPSGSLAKVAPDGTVSTITAPFPVAGQLVYAGGPIAADGAGRVWISDLIPSNVHCDGGSQGWGYAPVLELVTPDGGTHASNQCHPDVLVASDGAPWCVVSERLIRFDPTGASRSYELPREWTPTRGDGSAWGLHAGPGGSVWFTHQRWSPEGTNTGPLELASLTPDGELRDHPETLEQILDGENTGSVAHLHAWTFAPGGALWLAGLYDDDPAVTALPSVPEGAFVATARMTDWTLGGLPIPPRQDPPIVPPTNLPATPPVTPPAKPAALLLTLKLPAHVRRAAVRKSRSLTSIMAVSTSRRARVALRLSVTDRQARSLGLRPRASRTHGRLTIASGSRAGVSSTAHVPLTLTRAAARGLVRARGAVPLRLDATATAADGAATAVRTLTLR